MRASLISRYILDLEEDINQQESRLTAAEENIQGTVETFCD